MCSNEDPGQPKINTFKKKKRLNSLKNVYMQKKNDRDNTAKC